MALAIGLHLLIYKDNNGNSIFLRHSSSLSILQESFPLILHPLILLFKSPQSLHICKLLAHFSNLKFCPNSIKIITFLFQILAAYLFMFYLALYCIVRLFSRNRSLDTPPSHRTQLFSFAVQLGLFNPNFAQITVHYFTGYIYNLRYF